MKFKKPRTRIARIMAAVVCLLGIVAPVSAVIPAATAQAAVDCTPYLHNGDWYVNYGCKSVRITASHKYAYLGNGAAVNGVKAVQCADIYVTNDSSDYNADIWGEGNFYCQGPSGYVQCGGMNVQVSLSYADATGGIIGVGTAEKPRAYKCNPNPGPTCPAGPALFASTHFTYSNSQCWQTYAWLPSGNLIAIDGTVLKSGGELDTPKTLTICFQGHS